MLDTAVTTGSGPSAVAVPPAPVRSNFLLRRRADLVCLLTVVAVVAVAAQIPVLRTHLFYYYDDSAAAFLPGWWLIGQQILHGHLPLMDVNTWMGGDFAGEAQFGIFNPLLMANAVMVALLPDLALAAIIVKTEFLVLLALGVYLLAREYGARPRAASVVAVALPFSGFTLFWDTETWAAGLVAFTLTTHFWWTLRRYARGRLHPAVPLVVAVLACAAGSPYAVLGVVIVSAAVAVERLVARDYRPLAGVAAIGLSAGLVGAITFLPLLGIQPVGWRNGGPLVNNDTQLVPGLGQLLNLSAPSYVPPVHTWQAPTTPMTYLSWFVVPLLPWFDWSALARLRARMGIATFGVAYLLLALGPSNLWLFRWPARLIEYVYLAVCLVVALLLSAGLRRDHGRWRALGSAALVLLGTYLAWADAPRAWRTAEALVLVGALVGLALVAARYRPRLLSPALIVGTVAVLAAQISWFPANADVTPWRFPHNVAQLRETFAVRADGNTFAVAYPDDLPLDARQPQGKAYRDVLFGNLNQVAGMQSLNSYSGMGYNAFVKALCVSYQGGICREGYQRVFAADPGTGRPLADLLRLNTVTVLNSYLTGDDAVPPPGWQVDRRTDLTTTVRRSAPLPYPDGRVSWTAPTVTVTADHASGTSEDIRYTGGGRIMVAALAWPGWRATVNGSTVPVGTGPAGLIQLDVPDSAAGSELRLSFVPAGLTKGAVSAAAGVLLGIAYCVAYSLRRRRRRGLEGLVPVEGRRPANDERPGIGPQPGRA